MSIEREYVEQILRKVEELKSCGSQYILEHEIGQILEKYKNYFIEEMRADIKMGYCRFVDVCTMYEDDEL